jgi:hypothetical protein
MNICSEIPPALVHLQPSDRPRRQASRQPLRLDHLRRVEVVLTRTKQRFTAPPTRHFSCTPYFTLISPNIIPPTINLSSDGPASHG